MDKKQILHQIEEEYQQGLSYVETRREQFRNRIKRYNRQSKDSDKINIHLIDRAIETVIASNYSDKPKVQFVSRD